MEIFLLNSTYMRKRKIWRSSTGRLFAAVLIAVSSALGSLKNGPIKIQQISSCGDAIASVVLRIFLAAAPLAPPCAARCVIVLHCPVGFFLSSNA